MADRGENEPIGLRPVQSAGLQGPRPPSGRFVAPTDDTGNGVRAVTDERRLGNRLGGWIAMLVLVAAVAAFTFPWCVRLVYPIPFRAQVERAAWETGLDPFLIVAMMKVESRFNPKAESRKGARGLM